MNKWLAVIVLALSVVVGTMGVRNLLGPAHPGHIVAQGSSPVPPSPW